MNKLNKLNKLNDEQRAALAARINEIPNKVQAEVLRLLDSGAVDPESVAIGLLLAVAVANVADGWRYPSFDREFNALRRV